jgi:acylphosphatase
MTIARHLLICGRVQGVFYRGWTVETARGLGLTGWVRNRRNGAVEAIVQGDRSAVERFIERARRGPPAARVERVEVNEAEVDDGLAAFGQASTV